MSKILIKGALICPRDNELIQRDVLLDESGILKIAAQIEEDKAQVIEAHGCLLAPGLIDVHVHLREPGYTHKETIASGTMAAAHGGFTTIMAMPNLNPVPDDPKCMESYQTLLAQQAQVHVLPYASITKGEQGETLVDFAALKKMGIHAFSDDGVGVASDEIMLEAMRQSAAHDILLAAHTEDMRYRKPNACIHAGEQANQWGLVGIPSACEYEPIKRDLLLAQQTKAHYHICHMSTKESVALLKQAKESGADVSGEVSAHHLLLNELDMSQDANYKMNPPLRTKQDQQALMEGIQSGVIDLIASDHAPHTQAEKALGMVKAPFGIVGLETSFALLYTHLVKQGIISLARLLELMSFAPAKRFRMHRKGVLKEGYAADLALFDLHTQESIDPDHFYSKGHNTPFGGWNVFGTTYMTIVSGRIVYRKEDEK
ncbi:MAG: dihydroorotase [Erysipelotrichaceae bacterium]|nr:dihydroorotase [Erysipelotrichaceae bacterium]MCI9311754.1 dihydroorotase [Erysipelotrichaceae bacterium]